MSITDGFNFFLGRMLFGFAVAGGVVVVGGLYLGVCWVLFKWKNRK